MLLLACGGLLGPVQAALANTITVNTHDDTVDPLKCRLRDAITAANTNSPVNGCPAGQSGLDTIQFNWGLFCQLHGCQLILASALPTVTEDLTINGAGVIPTINGDHQYRILDFGPVTANVSSLHLINGQNEAGAAIHLDGTKLTLDHIDISHSQATFGGAIWEQSGTLTMTHSEIISNTAAVGGAIEQTGGVSIIASSSFTENVATIAGAIRMISGTRLA